MPLATTARERNRSQLYDDLRIALPPSDLQMSQDEEWCVVRLNGKWREIRLHDYDKLFSVPGLYERVIYDILKCDSPAIIRELLATELEKADASVSSLRVLDLGAGNGMVGEQLHELGVEAVVGVDISEAAADATRRDRPGIYADYHVVDMTKLSIDERRTLSGFEFNCLTCVAALGFGDIPTSAFANSFNLVASGGWVAFNIKSSYLDEEGSSGFGTLIRSMISDEALNVLTSEEYHHRIGTDRKPIDYTAIVGKKRRDIPMSLVP